MGVPSRYGVALNHEITMYYVENESFHCLEVRQEIKNFELIRKKRHMKTQQKSNKRKIA